MVGVPSPAEHLIVTSQDGYQSRGRHSKYTQKTPSVKREKRFWGMSPACHPPWRSGSPGVRRSLAADFPTRPITLVMLFPPGGGADPIGRPLASVAHQHLGQPMGVLNKAGRGGAVGTQTDPRAQARRSPSPGRDRSGRDRRGDSAAPPAAGAMRRGPGRRPPSGASYSNRADQDAPFQNT
jgi:hypothetical protein